MSRLSGTKRLTYLSLAVIFTSSFIVQTGHTLPVEHGSPQQKADISYASISDIVKKGSDRSIDHLQQPNLELSSNPSSIKNKKKKKKKKITTWGPPPTRRGLYRKPINDQQSLSGFSLSPYSTPWRHRMTYSLEWTTSPQFMDQIATAQRNLEIDNIFSSQKDDRYEASQRPVVMDIHLIPLDPAKPTELLLSRLDVTSGRATIQVRTEIPPGWYRLEIHFWDEGSKDDYRTLINNSGKDKAWNLQTSNLISSPGHAKPINTIMAHEVGVWRGNEAIEITTLTPELAEWTEFIETISQEARQERWNLANFDGLDFASAEAQRKRKFREMILEEHRSEEEFRMPNIFIDTPRIHDRMKSLLLGLWGKSKTGVPPAPLSSFERTNFPQEKFRFKDAMVVMSNREGTPDFLEAEIELMDDKDKEEEAKGNGPSLERIAWGKAMNELDSLMDIWSKTTEIREAIGGLEENKSNDISPSGLSDLHIRIEHGRDTVPEGSPIAWRSNRDRTVSWQTSGLIPDDVLLAIELIEAPKVNEEDGSLIMETRAELIQESLQQERFALFTDRIPISWGASVVRMPTWVLPGTYQVRLTGIDSQGKKWVDVSQPFVVLSDPYLYS